MSEQRPTPADQKKTWQQIMNEPFTKEEAKMLEELNRVVAKRETELRQEHSYSRTAIRMIDCVKRKDYRVFKPHRWLIKHTLAWAKRADKRRGV